MNLLLELAGIIFGALIILSRAARSLRPRHTLIRAAIISASAWIAEESSILLYRFYEYRPGWYLFLDQVPLLIVIIWPVIILSAMDLTAHIRNTRPAMGLFVGAAVVAADGLFIEPICVSAGLWYWNLPGLFGVPFIGILGWFFFALLSMRLMNPMAPDRPRSYDGLLLLVLPVIGTHLLLLLSWWCILRWTSFPFPLPVIIGIAWFVSFLITIIIHRNQTGRRIKKTTLLLRLPAALFFFVLLTVKAADPLSLAAYAFAFVPPYTAIMAQQYRRHAA